MILGIGIDLISINRIEKISQKFAQKFAQKIFTDTEIAKASKISQDIISSQSFSPQAIFYAKRFAAKEAFAKACGLGIGRGIDFCDIEIANDALGKPIINLLNDKEKFLLKHFGVNKIKIHLSITDEPPLAQAMVLLEGF